MSGVIEPIEKGNEKPVWNGLPQPKPGWKWEYNKGVLFQKDTPKGYNKTHVVSSLEKAIMEGNVTESLYWATEYCVMGSCFVTSLWTTLHSIFVESIGLSNLKLFYFFEHQYRVYQGFEPLVEKGAKKTNVTVSENCLQAILEIVRQMALSPKSRLVDSAARTFFMAYPETTNRRPFEPHIHFQRAPSKLVTQRPQSVNEEQDASKDQAGTVNLYERLRKTSHSSTWIPSASFVDDFDEEKTPRFSLYQLQKDDPTYIGPWCNAFVYQLNRLQELIAAHTTTEHDTGRDVLPWDEYEQIERGTLYYAGLIFQCTEPCTQRYHRHDSSNIIWEILRENAKHGSQLETMLKKFQDMCNEFRKSKTSRERSFIVFAILTYLRRFWILDVSMDDLKNAPPLNLKEVLAYHASNTLPVREIALDYTTDEGKSKDNRLERYLRLMHSLVGNEKHDDFLARNNYFSWSVLFESKRRSEGYQDTDKNLSPLVPFFSLARKDFEKFDLSNINTIPLDWFNHEKSDRMSLPWRGEFIPSNGGHRVSLHNFNECFKNVRCLDTPKLKEGLFVGTFDHPNFEPVDVFFIPCSNQQQAYYQCFLDELKPIFGVPKLGTHSLMITQSIVKKNKKLGWNAENWSLDEDEENLAQHLVMFPLTTLGFKNVGEVGENLSYNVVDILCQPVERKNKTPFYDFDNVLVKHQVINIFMFYLCLGVPRMTLNNMLMKDEENKTPVFVKSASERDAKEGDEKEKSYTMTVDERVAVANSLIVPFHELSAFSNLNFPDMFKRVQNSTLMRALFIESDKYFMLRFIDILMNLNTEALESIIQRFGGPVLEWSNAIRNNLRDARSGWLLWRDDTEVKHLKQKTKSLEKNRERKERAQAKKTLATETETSTKPKKKTAPKKTTRQEMEKDEGGDVNSKQVGSEGIKVNVKAKDNVKRRKVIEPNTNTNDALKE